MSDNLDHLLHRYHGNISDEQFSVLLSRSLDMLGNSQSMVKLRVDASKLHDKIDSACFNFIETIYAGSQKEGVIATYGSDTDTMNVYKYVICADNYLPFTDLLIVTVFQTDTIDVSPGYTKLKLVKNGNHESHIIESLFQSSNGETYISSDFFMNRQMDMSRKCYNIFNTHNATLSKSGPAIPVCSPDKPGVIDDIVFCFKCDSPALLQSWLSRTRRYGWPSPDSLYIISQMEAHVVPVGCKGSDTYYQEWRICFTKAEIHLVHSLNDTQTKLYIFLKMVSKHMLKTICPEITSYMLKNIVLWMCESVPIELFTDKQLVNRIMQALEILRNCVDQNCLPSYMIPERNLFRCNIEKMQNRELIVTLSSCLEEGFPTIIRRLDKIRGAMLVVYQSPAIEIFFKIKRNLVEKLFMLMHLRKVIIASEVNTVESNELILSQDEMYMNMAIPLYNLVLPEWRRIRGVDVKKLIQARLQIILS